MKRALVPLRLVVFPGGFNWPVWVAQAHGWFADNGIAVEVAYTPGSVYQLVGLIEGRFDVAITLVDNVIAYRSGQGEVPLAGEDLFAFMAADTRIFPTLVTLPEVKCYDDLRGRTLSVDALTTGYALVLAAMMERGGLEPSEYRLESVGGARERYLALAERRHAGCLLNSPFEALLQSRGFTVLDTAIAALGRYQGQVAAARKGWAEGHRAAAVGFVRAFLRAVDWLYDRDHREEAFAIYCANAPDADASAAATAHSVLFDPERGIPRDGAVDVDALQTVMALRSRYGRPSRALGAPTDYYDASYLAEARQDTEWAAPRP